MEKYAKDVNVAVLIDVENTSHRILGKVLTEASAFGRITHKRAYADFLKVNLKEWKNVCAKYGLEQVQQFAYVTKRGTSDGSLDCDGMELMYESNTQVFCIVSSDCDYAKLAMKLKGRNKWVVGFGKQDSPESWKNVCDQFIEIDSTTNSHDISLQELVSITFDQLVKDDVVNLGYLQEALIRKKPNFVSEYRAQKFSNIRKFIDSMPAVFKTEYSKSDTVVVRKI